MGNIEDRITALNNLLKKYFYFGIGDMEEIARILDLLLADFPSLDEVGNVAPRNRILGIIRETMPDSVALLLARFDESVRSFSSLDLTEHTEYLGETGAEASTMLQLLNNIMADIEKTGAPVRISDFELGSSYDLDTKRQLYGFIIYLIQEINARFASEPSAASDAGSFLIYFAILHSLAKEFNNVRGFYILFCSFADNLNLIQRFQLARDLGEEVLITSFYDKCPEYGWFVLFSIYMGQYNIVDSLLYGVILFSVIFKNTPISKPFFKNIIQSTFNFYRNFSLSSRAERIYHSYRNTIELEPYEGQKLDLSYFYLLLQNLDVDLEKKLRQYLDKEMPLIQAFGIDSAKPWFSFLCQVEAKQGLDPVLKQYEEAFEQEVPKGFIELIRAKAVINLSGNKEEVIRGLVRLKKTRNREDYISEIFHVTMPARSLMAASVKEKDIEGFLISSIVKADSSTYFVNQTVAEGSILPIIYQEDEELKSKLLNYPQYLRENLVILPHQVCLWLFESENRLWSLVYDGQEFIGIKNHGHWSKERMQRWVKENLKDFFFREEEVLNFNESCFQEFKEKLSFLRLNIQAGKEILLIPDIELSAFPPNLMQDESGQFLSQVGGITNILTPEVYIRLTARAYPLSRNFSITMWIPTESDDLSLHFIHSQITQTIASYCPTVITSILPTTPINSDINIFVAHGSNGREGFRAVYTDDNTAITSAENLFGRGKVAILFVCYSGSMRRRLFAHQMSSLVSKLFELDYVTVIAPFWALHVKIPSIWCRVFLDEFMSGKTISQSVHYANQSVCKEFRLPQAWAAMHVYGYPNLTRAP